MFFESDLYFLQQLFFPQAEYVALLDPENEVRRNFNTGFIKVADQAKIQEVAQIKKGLVLINLTNIPVKRYPFYEEGVEGIIHLGKKGEFFGHFTRDTFYYVLNDIKTIRWVYPNNLKKPFFLRFYDADAAYGNLFRGFCKLAGALGQMKWIADGKFYVLHKGELFFDNLSGESFDSYTLFMKDPYHSGKLLLQFINNDQIAYYSKFPVNNQGQIRIEKANEMLNQVNRQNFRNLVIPENQKLAQFLLLTNALTLKHKIFTKLKAQHFRAVGEYTRYYAKNLTLEDWLKQKQVLEKLTYLGSKTKEEEIPKGISAINLARLYQTLTHILNNLPLQEEFTVSLVHGDFTEENITIEQDRLILLDWEFAGFDYPVLGDFLDFILYRMEAEDRPEWKNFLPLWHSLVKQKAFQELCTEFANNFFLNFKVYLLAKILNYWWVHLGDAFLPYYVNWRIYFWRNLLEAFDEENQALSPFETKTISEKGES